jgi:Mrp family chromosome partitioning ATPase
MDSTVQASAPSASRLFVVALGGGLVVGVLIALVLGTYSRRLENEDDVAEKTGIPTLATVAGDRPIGGTPSIQRLTNLIALKVSRSAVVAVVSARRSDAPAELARALASQRASQGVRTLVVDATMPASDRGVGHSGLADLIADCDVVVLEDALTGEGKSDPERIKAVLEELRGLVDLVVVVVPPLLEDGAGQAICAAAEQTVIVVDRGASRSDDVSEAARLIEDVSGRLLGAVIVAPAGRLSRAERRADAAATAKPDVERPAAAVGELEPPTLQLGKQSSLQ